MSKIEKSKKVLKKLFKKERRDENDHKVILGIEKSVTIKYFAKFSGVNIVLKILNKKR